MASSSERKYRNVSYAFFGVGAAILIAGIVMLIIGIINSNKTSDCTTTAAPGATTTPAPTGPTTTPGTGPTSQPPSTMTPPPNGCSGSSVNPFTISAFSSKVSWDPTMSDPTSQAYTNAVNALKAQINAAFPNHSPDDAQRFFEEDGSQFWLLKISISKLVQPPGGTGIGFYGTLIFFGTSQPQPKDIQDALNSQGINANAYAATDSSQCAAFNPPPYPTNPPPTTTPYTGPTTTGATQPSTTTQSGGTTACPGGPTNSPRPPYNCDPFAVKTSVLFLIDAASPTEPGITPAVKQQLIVNYLQSFVGANWPATWQGLQMGVAVYYGNTAYMVDNYLCNTGACWTDTLSRITVQSPSTSVSAYASHNISAGLLFAYNEFSKIPGNNDPYGTALLAVVVTDGYQFPGMNGYDPASGLATNLKNSGFKLTAVVATPSLSVQNSVKPLVSIPWSDFFPLNSLNQLSNPTLLTYTANWVCAAMPFTTPAPPTQSTTNTLPQLTTTPAPSTTSGPTPPPTAVPGPCQHLDILFLIDESQSMLINSGFEATKTFVLNVVDAYKIIPDARFAWITFNSKLWVQTPFLNAQDFKNNVSNTRYNEGDTNFVLGFNGAVQTISTYSNATRAPVIIFVSDGYPNDGPNAGSVDDIKKATTILRCQLHTIIIGIGINEGATGASTIQQAIGVGASDGCTQSFYNDINSYNNITAVGLPEIEQDLHCFQQSNCNLDIIFMFENSELVDYAGREFELGAMVQTISDYGATGQMNYYGDHIGIVFFSSKDGFNNGAEYNRSGILDDPANNNSASSSFSQALALLDSFPTKYPLLGGASDVLLGLQMVSTLLTNRKNVDQTNNIPAIVILGRGAFHDADNCCDSPIAYAQGIRTQFGAQMNGVVVGRAADAGIMQSITGTPPIIPPNMNYYTDGTPFGDGTAMSTQISKWLEFVRSNSSCPYQPQLPYCPYYMEIVLVWRFSSRSNDTFQAIKNFITKMLLDASMGSFAGAEQGTISDRLTRISLITYDSLSSKLVFDLTQYQYMSSYAQAVANQKWPGQESVRPDRLSEALKEAQEVLLTQARTYASRSVIIFSDEFSRDDLTDSINDYNLLKQLYAGVFGVYIGDRSQDIDDYTQFTDQRISIQSGAALNPSKQTAITIANAMRNFVCAGQLPKPTAPPATTTPNPCSSQPPPTTAAPPTKAPAAAWPDITILLDTTADLSGNNPALNDRGFEAVRMFLVNTLKQYRIDANHTRVSLVTFDRDVKVVFTFNQNLDMGSLLNAIGNQWEYGPTGTHYPDRNLNNALQSLLTNVYNEPKGSGYDPNHVNYLWVFVTGLPTDGLAYAQTLYQIQSMGIHTQAIGLGSMDQVYLSKFGFDSFDYASPFDPVTGIASPTSPLPQMLYQQTTIYSTPPPSLAQFYADIVIVLEESTQLTQAHFADVQGFLTQFFTHLSVGPTGSSVAFFSYNDHSMRGWTLSQGTSQQDLLNLVKLMTYSNSNVTTPNINAALDSLNSIYLNASTGYQNRSTFVIFLTSSQTVTPAIDAFKALQVRNSAIVFAIDIGGNNTAPSYFETLTGDADHQGFSVSGPAALQNWVNKPITNGVNPMHTFFVQLVSYQQYYIFNHPIPNTQVVADIIFAIDLTLIGQTGFQSIQQYLVNLTAQFTISPQFTQVGVMTYSGSVIAGDGFALNRASNYADLVKSINGLTWTNNTGQITCDIAAAYNFIINAMLTPAQGWRYGPTFVIVLSSAYNSTLYNGDFNGPVINQLDSMAHTYGISLDGMGTGAQGFLSHYCQYVGTVSAPSSLTINSATSQAMVAKIDDLYKNDRFPPLPPITSVKADFIFVFDQSNQMLAIDYAMVKSFLINFVTALGQQNIGINGSQLAVVAYNSQGVAATTQSSFSLNSYPDGASLITALKNLQQASSNQMDSDITAAIKFVNSYSLTAAQGRRWWKPVFVTFIAIAPNITNPLSQSQNDMLNANSQTFGFDYFDNPTTFQYLAQITGNIDLVERISNFDMDKPGVQNYLQFVRYIWRDWANSNTRRR